MAIDSENELRTIDPKSHEVVGLETEGVPSQMKKK